MTALTTLVGLLPMATGSSTFVGIPYAPLGRVVGGGLAAATLLTLFCVPYLYSLLDDLRAGGGQVIAFATRRPKGGSPPAHTAET
jgi:Cu/Ag efflux pump CusA